MSNPIERLKELQTEISNLLDNARKKVVDAELALHKAQADYDHAKTTLDQLQQTIDTGSVVEPVEPKKSNKKKPSEPKDNKKIPEKNVDEHILDDGILIEEDNDDNNGELIF